MIWIQPIWQVFLKEIFEKLILKKSWQVAKLYNMQNYSICSKILDAELHVKKA